MVSKREGVDVNFKNILITFLSVSIALLSLQNLEPITIRFLFWTLVEIPKLYVILASTFTGVFVGIIIGAKIWRPQKKLIKEALTQDSRENSSL